ncbi:S8 family serine peptidase [Saccharothrix algeriensis]|uniref:S8 family serine peptidase n=1 Tax=Saccharothrix algeriensis TaxID=173560 RepID=A0A8T8HZ17_9PSEU|nr:S8 family serine peptidase [Saccharothrix algeriensis]
MGEFGASWRRFAGVGAAAVVAVGLSAAPASAQGGIVGANSVDAVAGSYIVVLKDRNQVNALADKAGVKVTHRYQAVVDGFAATMTEEQAKRLAGDPAVASVVQDQVVRASGVQPNPPSWGLDRVDQRDRPLNNSYTYPNTGTGVHVYVIDTGIRASHGEFGGRASFDYNAIDTNNTDCNGHGTHVAGTIGGATAGVAKDVRLHGVKVLDCEGRGTVANAVAGLDWVVANQAKPAVANLSLGSPPNDLFDSAVKRTIDAGVTVVAAAGNSEGDACQQSPARLPEAITVGATNRDDQKAWFSNFGACTDLFAPGEDITSAWMDADDSFETISGTSMAAPHVAGVVAQNLVARPTATPAALRDTLVHLSTRDRIADPGTGSPNLLLHASLPVEAGPDRLIRGEELTVGQSRTSLNGKYFLVLQPDGNLVLYVKAEGRPLWSTGTWGSDVTRAVLEPNGNFVLYSAAGVARWSTNTANTTADRLVVQDDDNVVLYGPGKVWWHRKK